MITDLTNTVQVVIFVVVVFNNIAYSILCCMIPSLLISNFTVMIGEQMMRKKMKKKNRNLIAMTAKMMNLFLVFVDGMLYIALTEPTYCWFNVT